uniref:RRM domain-containing protein n=2 Tax=Parascaris univalens TaxID=6257 RepID=A0A915BI55_PARUN
FSEISLTAPPISRGPMTPPGEPLVSTPGSSTPPPCAIVPAESSKAAAYPPQGVDSGTMQQNSIPVAPTRISGPTTPPEGPAPDASPPSSSPHSTAILQSYSASPAVSFSTALVSPQSSILSSSTAAPSNTAQVISAGRVTEKSTPHRDSECDSNGVELNKTSDPVDTTAKESREVHDAKRKFRVVGLTFPGKWIHHEKLMEIFVKSESFHMWFDKPEKAGGVKSGGVSVVFESADEAKAAFASVQKMSLDGASFKLQASRHFYGGGTLGGPSTIGSRSLAAPPSLPFRVDVSEADSPRRLYALHLTPSTDQTLLSSILGSEAIESIRLENDPIVPSERQAEIVFRTAEEANDARIELADGFEIDEGDRQSTMMLLTAEEYLMHMKNGSEKAATSQRAVRPSSSPVGTSQAITQSPSASFVPAPSITVEDVTALLQKHIEETRTNWAELNELGELWKLCDNVSRQRKGIPDSMLKPALLNVLERHQRTLPGHWLRQHVDDLIKMWKREIQNTKSSHRPTAYIMSAAPYSPPRRVSPHRGEPNETKKQALRMMMGIGAVLTTARLKLATEEGELDVDEDEYGNYTIDGQPLTFESWAEITKPTSPKAAVEPQPRILPEYRKIRNQRKKEFRERKMAEAKVQKMREAVELNKEPEEAEQPEGSKEVEAVDEGSVTESEAPEKKRELEEGEMSSDSSSPSSPSSSSDDDNSQHTSRDRRRKRRTQKNQQRSASQFPLGSQSPHFESLFKQLYEHRHGLLRSLSATHKHGFASVLNQILSSPQGMTRAQHDQMAVFMRTFSAHNLHGK